MKAVNNGKERWSGINPRLPFPLNHHTLAAPGFLRVQDYGSQTTPKDAANVSHLPPRSRTSEGFVGIFFFSFLIYVTDARGRDWLLLCRILWTCGAVQMPFDVGCIFNASAETKGRFCTAHKSSWSYSLSAGSTFWVILFLHTSVFLLLSLFDWEIDLSYQFKRGRRAH